MNAPFTPPAAHKTRTVQAKDPARRTLAAHASGGQQARAASLGESDRDDRWLITGLHASSTIF
jgi:hypothetical protein